MYQNKLQQKRPQVVVNRNKIKFESYGDLVDQDFSPLKENAMKNQDSHSQIENDETSGADLEDIETNKLLKFQNFGPQILPDDETVKRHKFPKFKAKVSLQC